ncbi:MAG: nucleoside phosphorylase [Oscillospiraceae bacterium]|nr:nucleoside phosphorylase [Oscillospiraceae bacterium]
MWYDSNDHTAAVITAKEQATFALHGEKLMLPKTAVVLFMGGLGYLHQEYETELLTERFPRFLNKCPLYSIKGAQVCFLDGGRGAPQAVDTVETLAVMGVENIIAVGMCGGYDARLQVGDILIPPQVFSEEGTSCHYYEQTESFAPDTQLFEKAAAFVPEGKQLSTVTTDSVYRQTFAKEALWRQKGAVGVDMETSAVLSVSRYLGIRAATLLMVSDVHPLHEEDTRWAWRMTPELRRRVLCYAMNLALSL